MTLKLLSNDWTLTYDQIITGTTNKLFLGNFTSNYLAILINSSFKKDDWQQGGFVAQEIVLPDSSIALANTTNLRLAEVNLIQFPILSEDNYNLYYLGLDRLETTTIKIYEYIGETEESLLPQINNYLESNAEFQIDTSALSLKIDNLENKIDTLEQAINNMNFEGNSILYRIFNIGQNQTKEIRFWENPDIEEGVKIHSLYIDAPEEDRLDFELLDAQDNPITMWRFGRNDTPYEFPKLEFAKFVKLKLKAVGGNGISGVFLYCTPVSSPLLQDIV